MSPWIIVGIVAYWAFAFRLASWLGHRLARESEGLRTVLVESREGVGDVRVLPARADAENARERAEKR